MHMGMGDTGARELAERLNKHTGLQELNVAYNNIGDNAALTLVYACSEHLSIHTVHLYLNPLSNLGKQSLYVREVSLEQGGTRRHVKVLASVTECSDISEDWHPILSIISKNASSWERELVWEQLQIFHRDLEWGQAAGAKLLGNDALPQGGERRQADPAITTEEDPDKD
ncbi:NLR family member X1-like [Oncorhynchus mykiss]|uniref:NLR family member X1-like n=1 Tax=Oncorhynchus mykiss TaxID=8022 RepID=UPI000B4EE687|nr:NLR family member X1-like [Oncorhynchus mykiss]